VLKIQYNIYLIINKAFVYITDFTSPLKDRVKYIFLPKRHLYYIWQGGGGGGCGHEVFFLKYMLENTELKTNVENSESHKSFKTNPLIKT
jgi:hypothetical protein